MVILITNSVLYFKQLLKRVVLAHRVRMGWERHNRLQAYVAAEGGQLEQIDTELGQYSADLLIADGIRLRRRRGRGRLNQNAYWRPLVSPLDRQRHAISDDSSNYDRVTNTIYAQA